MSTHDQYEKIIQGKMTTTFLYFIFLSWPACFHAKTLGDSSVEKPVKFQNWNEFIKKSNSSDEFRQNPQKYTGKEATKIWLSLEPLRILSVNLDEQV